MSKKFAGAWRYKLTEYQPDTGVSQTVPDQALTIRELYLRYARGQSLDIGDNEGYYEEDSLSDDQLFDLEDYHRGDLDLTDLQYLRQKNQLDYERITKASREANVSKETNREQQAIDKSPVEQSETGGKTD